MSQGNIKKSSESAQNQLLEAKKIEEFQTRRTKWGDAGFEKPDKLLRWQPVT